MRLICKDLAGVYTRVFSALVLGAAGLGLTGCGLLVVGAAGVAGGGSVAYIRGDLEVSLDGQPDSVAEATRKAFRSLGIDLIRADVSKLDARVEGRTAMDRKIMVLIEQDTVGASKLAIRVGVFGDAEMSVRIYDEIKKNM